MNPELSDIKSIINGWTNAKDNERVFTYIEFTKMFGYDNDVNTFITTYKDYVTRWANIKKASITLNDDDFILSKMVDILKAITLDYASYEEQDFIAHIDLTNKTHLKALTALYSRKIREITEFYRKKRNESVLVVRRNSMKGSTKSIQEIIYEKVFDFIFSNKNIVPSYKDIKRDLLVSVENYVDTYSEYFDIPRVKEFTDESRAEMLSANMNDVDYRMYLEIELVVSEILFSGNVMLEEIPLIAQIGVDLSQSCVGDMLALKNTMVANTTVNQVDLNEQIALKRQLYEKFLGCDLWYMYVDLQGNITMDLLCKAKNPTGNLLNCGFADTATIESDQLELLSHIGLFFKPDKTSILKVNAKDYTWTVDTDMITEDTVYVFPDPNKYGDIGNNKSASYPLIMEYKLDYDIKNLSSGEACNDPMLWITDQGWAAYYSKQDDDFKSIKNDDFEYAFTYLANQGYLHNYQVDAWGNQFGLLKGCKTVYKTDANGNFVLDEEGNQIVDKVTLVSKYNSTEMKFGMNEPTVAVPLCLNGGYFENPFYDGNFGRKRILNSAGAGQVGNYKKDTFYRDKSAPFLAVLNQKDADGNVIKKGWKRLFDGEIPNGDTVAYIRSVRQQVTIEEIALAGIDWEKYYEPYNKIHTAWVYKGIESNTRPFNFDQRLTMNDYYRWSGLHVKMPANIYVSQYTNNFVNCGTFGSNNGIQWIDNFRVFDENKKGLDEEDNVITNVIRPFLSINLLDKTGSKYSDVKFESEAMTFEQMQEEKGTLYIKLTDDLYSKPQKLTEAFSWVAKASNLLEDIDDKIVNFSVMYNTLILETEDEFIFIPYLYDGKQIIDNLGVKELYRIPKKGKIFVGTDKERTYEFIDNKLLFVEEDKAFYILQVELLDVDGKDAQRRCIIPHIYKFDPINYTMIELINLFDATYKTNYEINQLDKIISFLGKIQKKREIIDNGDLLKDYIIDEDNYYNKFIDFEIPYAVEQLNSIDNVEFTYNTNLGTFLLSFVFNDLNGTPYIYEHKFKVNDLQTLHGSLVSNIYTLKGTQIGYTYNSTLDGEVVATIPYEDVSATKKIIFEKI